MLLYNEGNTVCKRRFKCMCNKNTPPVDFKFHVEV